MNYKFFRVKPEPLQPGRKTRDYAVVNKIQGAEIGRISWYGPWRQFCLFPEPNTVWSAGCFADIEDAIRKITKEKR